MNVAKHLYSQQRFLQWTSHNTCKTRTILSDHNRPMRQHGISITTQSKEKVYPTRMCPIARHNNRNNKFILTLPIQNYNSFQPFCFRHHCAASTPSVKSASRKPRWKEKQEHKSKDTQCRPNYRRRRSVIKKFPENMVKIEFMHSIEDIKIYQNRYNRTSEKTKRAKIYDFDETPGIFRIDWSQSSILQLAHDYYGVEGADQLELEYYDYETNDWKVVPEDVQSDTELIKLYKGKGNRTMPLRIQSDFDNGQNAENNLKDMRECSYDEAVESSEAEAIRIIIRRAVYTLRRERYVRISDTKLGRRLHPQQVANDEINVSTMNSEEGGNSIVDNSKNDNESNDDETSDIDEMTIISTKQWIIEHAGKDEFLASLLMSRPGALKHLVQCIHWDVVWK